MKLPHLRQKQKILTTRWLQFGHYDQYLSVKIHIFYWNTNNKIFGKSYFSDPDLPLYPSQITNGCSIYINMHIDVDDTESITSTLINIK